MLFPPTIYKASSCLYLHPVQQCRWNGRLSVGRCYEHHLRQVKWNIQITKKIIKSRKVQVRKKLIQHY